MRRLAAVMIAVVALVFMPATGFALQPVTDTSGAEMASMRSGLDAQRVRFEGEVISEALAGGVGHVWVNVLSNDVAIGVWMPVEFADELEVFGRFSHTGDRVRITGTFNEGCDTHGGDLDVHATSLELLERGEPREHPAAPWKLFVGLGGLGVAYVGWRRMKRIADRDRV
jgi:hypothetical protein